ncbi:hypothetical protein [Rhizobium sp. Root1220]|uniref:hypothetical protein n=1 Tax=Rhizobium sp. Root1220 TaxID=1736432 RepID=UPI0006F905BB|nr:hypothetical protein [Rhizobium sp. Root1220]KQV83283.1 hypothetical protein ASC90_22090 [Rhizobium sp. Root1220]
MSGKHTLGPWSFHGDEGIFSENKSVLVPTYEYDEGVGLLVTTYDACLLAAAPDLFEALKALSASIFVPGDERSPELSTAIEMTVAALAKAGGE